MRNQLTPSATSHSAMVMVIQCMLPSENLPTPAMPIPATHNSTSAGKTSFMWSAAIADTSPARFIRGYRNSGPNAATIAMMWTMYKISYRVWLSAPSQMAITAVTLSTARRCGAVPSRS